MQSLLSFERAPPLWAPLRFLLTAPLFLAGAGFLMLFAGEEVFTSRWMPASLAFTHLLTIGFMLMTMLGALIQILPVVAGANLPSSRFWLVCLHGALCLGTLLLVAAFLGAAEAFPWAASLLAGAVCLFIVAAGVALWPVPVTSPTIAGIKLSLFGIAGVAGLGVSLALAIWRGWPWPLMELTDLHAGWGLAAWAGVLLAAVSYVVVPMFQLTPAYRARFSWWLPPLLVFLALIESVALWGGWSMQAKMAEWCMAGGGAAFALVTLNLQRQRRRARWDAPSRLWQGGLIAALLAFVLLPLGALMPDWVDGSVMAILFGVVLGLGGFVSLIVGMLYRIVPFLLWLDLQQRGVLSHVGKLLADRPMGVQMKMHAASVALCMMATFWPESFSRLAGLSLLVNGIWLERNLLLAVRRYRQTLSNSA